MTQTLIWETKHHEEEVTLLTNRVSALQEELARVGHEKGSLDGRIVEMDQLVGQLLALNENLVAQLSGKPWRVLTPSLTKKKVKKVKKTNSSSTSSVPRVASISITSKKPLVKSVGVNDIDQLRSLHKAYAKMASSLTRALSPATKSPHRSRKSEEVNYSTASLGSSRGSTRLGQKKKSSSASSDDFHNHPSTPVPSSGEMPPATNHSASLRIPKPTVSFDGVNGDLHHQDTSMHRSYLTTQQIDVSQLRSPGDVVTNHSAAAIDSDANASFGYQSQSQDELKDMISSLEEEFSDLNRQYRRLLSNVSAASTEVPESLNEQ